MVRGIGALCSGIIGLGLSGFGRPHMMQLLIRRPEPDLPAVFLGPTSDQGSDKRPVGIRPKKDWHQRQPQRGRRRRR